MAGVISEKVEVIGKVWPGIQRILLTYLQRSFEGSWFAGRFSTVYLVNSNMWQIVSLVLAVVPKIYPKVLNKKQLKGCCILHSQCGVHCDYTVVHTCIDILWRMDMWSSLHHNFSMFFTSDFCCTALKVKVIIFRM